MSLPVTSITPYPSRARPGSIPITIISQKLLNRYMELLYYTANSERCEGACENTIHLTTPKTWKQNIKKIYFMNPNDFSVTSVFTAPTWYTVPDDSSFMTTSAGEKSEVSIW